MIFPGIRFRYLPQPFRAWQRGFPVSSPWILPSILLSLFLCRAVQAQFTTNAYEGFSYSAGSLAGQNGGTGWTTAWSRTYAPGGDFQVSSTGLTYSGLPTTGGSIVWGSGGTTGISEDSRSLLRLDTGLVYVQFLGQFGASSGGGTPNIRLLDGGTLTGGFGANGGSTMSILNASLQPASGGSSSSSAALSSLNLVVARIDYQNNDTKMWVNPDLSTFNYQTPPAANAEYLGLAPTFDTIAIYSRSPANVDEIMVMQEPVPEPGSASLLIAGAALLSCRRLRRTR